MTKQEINATLGLIDLMIHKLENNKIKSANITIKLNKALKLRKNISDLVKKIN